MKRPKIPWERRPVTDPAAARAAAYASMHAAKAAQRKAPPSRPLRKPEPAMTPSGWAYLQAERRWQAFLRSKASTDTHRSGRDVLDLAAAKARRAKLARRTDTYIAGSDPTPQGVYSADEIQALGERGLALKMKNGTFAYPIQNGRDMTNSWLALQKTERPSEREGAEQTVRSWIVERATLLKVLHLLPKGVAGYTGKLHPKELEGGAVGGGVGKVNVEAAGGGGAGASEGGGMSGGFA
jgi:hypothetical protein